MRKGIRIIVAGLLIVSVNILHTSTMQDNITDPSIDNNKLKIAWRGIQYYQLTINGETFGGPKSRPFSWRWNLIKDSLNFSNKKVLELGSHIGLTSIFIKKYGKAKSCLAVDHSASVLNKGFEVEKVFGVHIDRIKLELDTDDYETILDYDYDIVTCMSLINWVKDKDRLMRYLSKFPYILFEGHENAQAEIKRFAQYGITEYVILGDNKYTPTSDMKRTVILFKNNK